MLWAVLDCWRGCWVDLRLIFICLFEGFTFIARRWRRALFISQIENNLCFCHVSTLLGVHLTNRCKSEVHAYAYICPNGLCHFQVRGEGGVDFGWLM
jgi:hypothetical protein